MKSSTSGTLSILDKMGKLSLNASSDTDSDIEYLGEFKPSPGKTVVQDVEMEAGPSSKVKMTLEWKQQITITA